MTARLVTPNVLVKVLRTEDSDEGYKGSCLKAGPTCRVACAIEDIIVPDTNMKEKVIPKIDFMMIPLTERKTVAYANCFIKPYILRTVGISTLLLTAILNSVQAEFSQND